MAILAKNLKMIRKELGCTQSVLSGILNVGFRTFVRYEAGERDAPVAVLVKIARLGNISLEQLLTSEISKNDIAPLQKISKDATSTIVRKVNFKDGTLVFDNPPREELITLEDTERKILGLYRKMSSKSQKDCMSSLSQIVEMGKISYKKSLNTDKGQQSLRKNKENPEKSKNPADKTVSQSGENRKPGRKKLDKKALQEKIDKLKMLTQNINKITVR
jgi:transcriptional regulator with XRE-family HTH domain